MSDSEKETEPSSVSSIPPLLADDGENEQPAPPSSNESLYKYRDFSHVTEDDDAELAAENPPPTPSSRGNSESSIRVQKFPVKLYVILAQKEFHDIIAWMPHGRSWKVLKASLFESMVMPLFFEYSNYHSFNRLVNAWSFRRISSGPDRGSYYHELFLRGMPHLQKYMRRLPKTHKKLPMSKKDEPDFYALDKAKPLPALEEAPIPGLQSARNNLPTSAAVSDSSAGMPFHLMNPPIVTPSRNMQMGPAPVMSRFDEQQQQQYYDPSMGMPQMQMMQMAAPQPMYNTGYAMQPAHPQRGQMRPQQMMGTPRHENLMTAPLIMDQQTPMTGPPGYAEGGYYMAQQPQQHQQQPYGGGGISPMPAFETPARGGSDRGVSAPGPRRAQQQYVGVE